MWNPSARAIPVDPALRMVAGALALWALLAAIPDPALATSADGHWVPTYTNFCGEPTVNIPVIICNTAAPGTGIKWYSLELRNGTFVGCDHSFDPQWHRTPAFWGLQPGECASFDVTLDRPDILDSLPEACFWFRIAAEGTGTVGLGSFVVDKPALCSRWHFYEAEWARFVHPSDPVTQVVDLTNPTSEGLDFFYEIRAFDTDGKPLKTGLSLNGMHQGAPLTGLAVLGPGQTLPIAFEMTWTSAQLQGPFELALLADTDYDGIMERMSSIPLFNAQVFRSGGVPSDVPTAAPPLPNAGLHLSITPNPFNPSARVAFTLGAPGLVSADILDARGRLVRRLIDDELPAGPHQRSWNGRDDQGGAVANGVYTVSVRADGRIETRQAVLLK